MTKESMDDWIIWLIEVGSKDVLWYISWYQMSGVLPHSQGHSHVFLLGFTHSTWYSAVRVQRQMGIDQHVPKLDGIHIDARINPRVTKAILSAWVRDLRHLVRAIPNPTLVQTSPEYQDWLLADVYPIERIRRMNLLREVEDWDGVKAAEKEANAVEKEVVPEVSIGIKDIVASPERECAPRRKRAT